LNIETQSASPLSLETKRQVLDRVLSVLQSKFYKPELLTEDWAQSVASHRPAIEAAATHDDFEQAMSKLLHTLNTSHLGFFHDHSRLASSRAALSATYLEDETDEGRRWIFQDVHKGGAAARARIQPGDILLRVNGEEIVPSQHPTFSFGATSVVDVVSGDGKGRTAHIEVARPKGKNFQFIQPQLVEHQLYGNGVGYLRVAMFPGMIGVDVANEINAAAAHLENAQALVIDLRGNTGGGVGALRVMSLLTSSKIPVGYSSDRRWANRDLGAAKLSLPRFNRIPSKKLELWTLGARFLPSLVRKSPVVLETEGLGPRSFHGKIVLLVDRHTASAAEMILMFAKENGLATIVGERTAGRLLAATSEKVGGGFRLAFPSGSYHTWSGTALEGSPIEPDVRLDFNWRERRTGIDLQLERALQLASALK
jgi:carboxyl-terminal processing protease